MRLGGFKMRGVSFWHDPCLEREPRGVRRDHLNFIRFQHHPGVGPTLLLQDVAKDAAIAEAEVAFAAVDLLLNALGNDGESDQLRVRVLEGGAGAFAMVLEEQNVSQAMIALEVENAVAKGPKQVFDALFRQLAQ